MSATAAERPDTCLRFALAWLQVGQWTNTQRGTDIQAFLKPLSLEREEGGSVKSAQLMIFIREEFMCTSRCKLL